MKKILVPTDFSENAYNAFISALELGRLFNAKVVLCTVYDQPSGVMVDIVDRLKQNAEDDLYNEIEKAKKAGYDDVEISQRSQRGDTSLAIGRMASLENADLVVMGKTGRSGLSNKLFGSNTARTINDTDDNILIIPEKTTFRKPDSICFATDLKSHSELDHSYAQCLTPLVSLAKFFNASIDILHFVKKQEDLSELSASASRAKNEIEAALNEVEHQFVFGIKDDVEDALETHFKNSDYDLICMIKHDYSWVRKMFNSSPTIEVAFSTKIPLLILH